MTTTVVDLRRPVQSLQFIDRIRAQSGATIYAFTPLAAWLLERAGLAYRTMGDFIDDDWFHKEGLANLDRLEEAIKTALPDETESWFGLMYALKQVVDYALIEERRREMVEREQARVFADLPVSQGHDLSASDILENRAALYLCSRGAPRHEPIERRRGSVAHWTRRLRRLTLFSIKRKLLSSFPRDKKPVLVTKYIYDWAPFHSALSRRYNSISEERLAAEALSSADVPVAEIESQTQRLVSAIRSRLEPLLPRVWDDLERLLRSDIADYARMRWAVAERLPRLCRERDIRAALSTFAGSPAEYLVNYYLKRNGFRTLFFQHGGYQVQSPLVQYAERLPATHNLTYGAAVSRFLERTKGGAVIEAGSPALGRLHPGKTQAGRYLYLLYPNHGRPSVGSASSRPFADPTRLFARHRRMMELFARRPEAKLTIREHHCQKTFCLYEPLSEIRDLLGADSISFDSRPVDADRYMDGYDVVIFDYASTGLLQALTKGLRVICHTGAPYGLAPEEKELLRGAAVCVETEGELLQATEKVLDCGFPPLGEDGRRRYLGACGAAPKITAADIEKLLEPDQARTA